MKKLMMITLCLLLTAGLMLSVSASEPKVVLASGAQFAPGSTLTVNIQAMTDMDARIYNAYLEGTVQYQWHSSNDPIPGATKASYTIQSGDKSVFVVVTCDDLVLTSTRYLVTSAGIVVTRKTTPTTVKPTTKTSTTKAPTVAATTQATGQDQRVAPSDAPVVTPSTDHTTVPTTIPAAIATTVPTQEPTTHASSSALENGAVQTPQESPTEQTAEEFPWWTVILVGAVAVAIIAVAAIATRKKK